MSADDLRRIKQQQDANAVRLQRLEQQLQANNARVDDDDEERSAPYIPPHQPQYNTVDQNKVLLDQIAQNAANLASQNVMQNITAQNNVQDNVKKRMERLVAEYPAIQEDDSALTVRARDEYQRITKENPTLDEATKYELSVKSAASALGARPVNASLDETTISDFVMPAGHNAAKGSGRRAGKSRLTENIIKNAQALGINVDPRTPEGKKNLAELDVYSERFNADSDDSQYRYR